MHQEKMRILKSKVYLVKREISRINCKRLLKNGQQRLAAQSLMFRRYV